MSTVKLSKSQFRAVKATVANLRLGVELKRLRKATYDAIKRVGAERDVKKAINPVEADARQESAGVESIVRWTRRIRPKDWPAVRQLIEVDALVVKRR